MTNTPMLLSLISLVIAIIIGSFVFFQLRYYIRQLKLSSLSEIVRTNRELITLGINNPDLFRDLIVGSRMINNKADFDPKMEIKTRYCQLWINQAYFLWEAHKLGLYTKDNWEANRRDIVETLFESEEFKKRWQKVEKYYPKDFGEFVKNSMS